MPKAKNVEIYRKSFSVAKRKDRQRKQDEQYIREALKIGHNGFENNSEMFEIKKGGRK